MIPTDGLTPQYFLTAFRRRLWYVVIPFFLVMIASLIYCIKAPKLYRSSSLVLIQPQEVPADYVRPTVTSDVTPRLNSITEQIMSRSNLVEIIKKYDLYPELRAAGALREAVAKMSEHVTININEVETNKWGEKQVTSFKVAFEGREPTKVRDVTATVANLYIDYNFRLRSEQAAGTTRFLDRELERMKEELRQKEELVREFKEKYMGRLPEQMQNNYNILTQLQRQMDSINGARQKTEDRKIFLQTQLNRSGNSLSLGDLHDQLQTLKSRYSDRHPDVIRLRETIAKRENEQESALPESDADLYDLSPHFSTTQRLTRAREEGLLYELTKINREISSLRSREENIAKEIEDYRQRIEIGPKIEQMFVDLRRDYQRANANYQSLLNKKLQAELAENLERTQKGEQFKIIDPASLPREPFKPKILALLMLSFMLSVSSGIGLAILRDYLDQTFRSPKEIESILELPVLVSIPLITTDKDRRWNILKKAATVCVLLVMSSTLLFALFILWRRNPTLLPLPFL